MTALPQANPDRAWTRLALWCAAVAAVFCLLVSGQMIHLFLADKAENPLVIGPVDHLKAQLEQSPTDEALKTRIRQTDQELRRNYWLRRGRLAHGAYLLAGAALVLVIALKAARRLGKRLPEADWIKRAPGAPPTFWPRLAVVAAGGGLVALLGVTAAFSTRLPPIPRPIVEENGPPLVVPWPSQETLAKNWPVFRGWGSAGIVSTNLSPAPFPTTWDAKSGQNILWKTRLDLPGHSSPIVWNGKVFLSGANEEERHVYCYDAKTGDLLWDREVPTTTTEPPHILEDTGYAAPTLATDGGRVFALFATGDLAAFDFQGRRLWKRSFGLPPDNGYGLSNSLTLWQGLLFVQWDVGNDAEKPRALLLALDTATGKTLWETKRPTISAWSSPVLTELAGQPALVTAGNPWNIAYDAATGLELWRIEGCTGDVGPSPVVVQGVTYLANDRGVLAAIKDGQTAWRVEPEKLPDIVSPVSDGRFVWTIAVDSTTLFCYSAADGKELWQKELGTEQLNITAHATPVIVGQTLWVTDTRGTTRFLQIGPEYKELGRAEVSDEVSASLAFADGKVFIRGKKHLWCIGK